MKYTLFKSRKAQITIFIIIGIILLFSSALIMYIKNRVTVTTPSPAITQSTPEDLIGMKKYIDDCVYSTGKEAVNLLGGHGGYIYPEKKGIRANTVNPTEGTGVELVPGSGYIVPYWYYLSTPNNCVQDCKFSSNIPTLKGTDPDSIESQISDFVDNNIRSCLNNFEVYRIMGYDVNELGALKTKTTITEDSVVIEVSYPIEAGRDSSKLKRLESFSATLPVNLKRVYEFAQLIINKESENNYIETNTLNLITYHSDRTKNQLPPMADYSWQAEDVKTWNLDDANKEVKTVLALYTSLLRIRNTNNGISFSYPILMTQTAMDKMVIDLNDSNAAHPLNVEFRYIERWPIYMDITPRNGKILSAKSVLGSFGVLGLMGIDMKQYEFQYDVSYPVLIRLDDPTAFNNEGYKEGYSFLFAIESNIRNNKPLSADFEPLKVTSSEKTFVCDEMQKKSGNITVNSYDAATKKPLEGVSVTFSFSKEGCQLGVTSKSTNTSVTSFLTERYPTGIGTLTFAKADYLKKSMLYGTKEGGNDEINVSLYQIVPKNVSLKIYRMEKGLVHNDFTNVTYCTSGWALSNYTPQSIWPNESVTVILTKEQTPESPDYINEALVINGSNPKDSKNNTMRLAPGRYEVRIMTVLYENLTLPGQSKDFGSGKDKTTIWFNETILPSPYNEGIMQFNNETYYFDIAPEDLYRNTSLKFYAIAYDLKSTPTYCRSQFPSDLSPTPDINNITISKRALLIPRFS